MITANINSNRIKYQRHGIGIVLPVPCRFAVIGFGIRGFAGHRVQGPAAAAGSVQLSLLLLGELLVGDEYFTCATIGRICARCLCMFHQIRYKHPHHRRRSLRTAQKRQTLDALAVSSTVLRVSSSPHRSALRRGPHVRASSARLRKSSRFWRLLFLRLYSAAPPFPHATRCAGLARGPVLKYAVRKPGAK